MGLNSHSLRPDRSPSADTPKLKHPCLPFRSRAQCTPGLVPAAAMINNVGSMSHPRKYPFVCARSWSVIVMMVLACAAAQTRAQSLRYSMEIPFAAPFSLSSAPAGLAGNGSKVYFSARTPEAGRELWVTDGTAAGTRMVVDLVPGKRDGISATQTAVTPSGRAYFVGTSSEEGTELFVTDGTAVGTHVTKDIRPGALAGTAISSLVALGEVALFIADDGVTGPEIWRSDGTEAGTFRLSEVDPGTASLGEWGVSEPAGGYIYFSNYSSGQFRLWQSDGTLAGTRAITGATADAGGAGGFVMLGSKTYFGTGTGVFTIGAGASTAQQLAAPSGQVAASFSSATRRVAMAVLDTKVYFAGKSLVGSDSPEPWATDGSQAGTTRVLDIVSGAAGSAPEWLVQAGGLVYFSATTAANGRELWASDGTPSGTQMIRDIRSGTGSSNAQSFTRVSNKIVFLADDGSSGVEPWVTDGTPPGTVRLADLEPGAGSSMTTGNTPKFFSCGDRLVFAATNSAASQELYVTDGTPAGTALLKDIAVGQTAYFSPQTGLQNRTAVIRGDTLFFATQTAFVRTDGSPEGTTAASGVLAQTTPFGPELALVGSRIVFVGTSPASGAELWATDGLPGTEAMVKDIRSGTGSSLPRRLFGAGSRVYFETGFGDANSRDLWVSDGTSEGTQLLVTIPGISRGSLLPLMAAEINGSVLVHIGQTVVTDGTPTGTQLLVPGQTAGTASQMTKSGALVYFFVQVGTGPQADLWRSDGTSPGTWSLGRFELIAQYADIGSLGDGRVVFPARLAGDTTAGTELWISDGTVNGTGMVLDMTPGPDSTPISVMGSLPGKVILSVYGSTTGSEPWVTDGTAAGTVMLADTDPGSVGGVGFGAVLKDRMYLISPYLDNLWVTDGTPVGTMPVPNAPGPRAPRFNIASLIPVGSTLFCLLPGSNAPELWVIERCRADTNNSGGVTIDDLFLFFNAWFQGQSRGDFDLSGQVTIDDLFLFINAWFNGCG